jgi:hypothetical protein
MSTPFEIATKVAGLMPSPTQRTGPKLKPLAERKSLHALRLRNRDEGIVGKSADALLEQFYLGAKDAKVDSDGKRMRQGNGVILESKRLPPSCTPQQSVCLEREDGMKAFLTELLLLRLVLSPSNCVYGRELLIRLEISQRVLGGTRSLILVHSQKWREK